MSTSVAKKCFEENLQLFANPKLDPEKFNLYSGLLSLATAIANVEQSIGNIEHEIHQLKNKR